MWIIETFFGYCSAELFDTLSNKYNLVNNRKLNRNKIVSNMYEIVRSNIDLSQLWSARV